jgi:lipoprotein-anchoring transpeptidase ErfK/SrfK
VRRGGSAAFLVVCAAGGLLSALLLAATPYAIAQTVTGTTTGTTTTAPPPPPTTTTPPPTTAPPPRPVTIPAGVTIGRQAFVGGLSPAQATDVVRDFFARPLSIRIARSTLRVTPRELGASAYVGNAVKAARVSPPGRNVPLKVKVSPAAVDRYLAKLARRFDRATVDSQLLLRNGKPFVTKDARGRRLQVRLLSRAIVLYLKTHARELLQGHFEAVAPQVTRRSIGDVIVIRRGVNRLELYDGMNLRRTFGVATGTSQYPTPLGRFHIVVKWRNPWWYPPASDWAKDAKPIPPGPGNPLGTRWMGLSAPLVGIHGTPDAASIGYSASHGCIRMLIPEVEWLFEQVGIGTPVFVVR